MVVCLGLRLLVKEARNKMQNNVVELPNRK